MQFKCFKQIKDNSGRVIIVLAEIQEEVKIKSRLSQKLILANIYAPHFDDQSFFFAELEGRLLSAGDHAVILGGGEASIF